MADGTSLIDLGEVSKPATTLIEKISEAIGGAFRPYQIRRIARAEADAQMIAAVSQIEVTELQRRAMQRFVAEEARKQDNIESITSRALPLLADRARPQDVEDDWIAHFFDKCRLISDEQMQSLWAQVLAGQANSPGRFSKRTVDTLASLDKSDAEIFRVVCSLACGSKPLIYEVSDSVYACAGLTFGALAHLDDIGLIRFEPLGGFRLIDLPKYVDLDYFADTIPLELPLDEKNPLYVGSVILSKVGVELSPLCGAGAIAGFVDYLVARWTDSGIRVASRWPRHVSEGTTPLPDALAG